mmetsp:Transcript_37106/g.73009  ORF Transcript_37106/g.73009 Transcript_37106/m.73009 type:complete len:96 (+) Transcript_37106:338-625(+)
MTMANSLVERAQSKDKEKDKLIGEPRAKRRMNEKTKPISTKDKDRPIDLPETKMDTKKCKERLTERIPLVTLPHRNQRGATSSGSTTEDRSRRVV